MSLDNVRIPIRANRTLSITSINNKLEIAVLSNIGEKYGYDPFFITENYFDDLYESCPTFSDLRELKNIIDRILEVEDKHD